MLACLLQALGGCDHRCGRGCDRLDGRLAAIGGFPAAGDSESAFSDGCLAALGLVSVCCSGVRPSCLNNPVHFMVQGVIEQNFMKVHEILLYHVPPCSLWIHGNTTFPLLFLRQCQEMPLFVV